MERISVSIFAADNNLRRSEIHDGIHRGRLDSVSEPLSKKGYGGQRKAAYVILNDKVPIYLAQKKEAKLKARKKAMKVLVLRSGVEVLNNAFGKIMAYNDHVIASE